MSLQRVSLVSLILQLALHRDGSECEVVLSRVDGRVQRLHDLVKRGVVRDEVLGTPIFSYVVGSAVILGDDTGSFVPRRIGIRGAIDEGQGGVEVELSVDVERLELRDQAVCNTRRG